MHYFYYNLSPPCLQQWNRPKMSGPGSVLHHALHRHLQEGGPPHRLFRCPATRGGHRIIIIIFSFFLYCIQHCFICRPSDSTVSEDAGIEPRTVATMALMARRSSLSAISHSQSATYIDHPLSARSHPQNFHRRTLYNNILETKITYIFTCRINYFLDQENMYYVPL
jgi:hypothetical protein